MANLRRLDLNLPVTFDALLAEHNVTRAAERLHLSQPSVSVHLAKLREALGDPLLLPGPRGMRPTARAEQLREPLRAALEGLRQVVAPVAGFVPAEAAQRWRIAATDYGTAAILLPAMAALRKQAPGTRLAVLEMVPARIAVQAERGGIDLALHASDDALPGLHRRPLFAEKYVLVGRDGHPQLRRRPTLRQFCMLEHVQVSPDGGGFAGATDRKLAELDMAQGGAVGTAFPHRVGDGGADRPGGDGAAAVAAGSGGTADRGAGAAGAGGRDVDALARVHPPRPGASMAARADRGIPADRRRGRVIAGDGRRAGRSRRPGTMDGLYRCGDMKVIGQGGGCP
ncbi:LysR substrate-binding domain-containing protein [Xanthomonas sp. H13-6]|uniref:LysR substrate-binding domain-containing protein n=1 Tax=Xanthomonas chitinilytica TaxID=2989819 RepID=A0ABT3JXR0_9XANT|nr:LysR substrate-binding domain-containing protein [Xanthomonas sp. H13-6]MCW4473014.1 LysR substrate-binding domain-containing protein [Xanthomonas sp. H13-6]